MVQEFVRKAHADLPGTKALLAEQPSLLNATWDWGGGDFETGLGGAGHMGNREIAEFLIGQGARLDIFVAAMLGKLDIVRALLTAWPGCCSRRGRTASRFSATRAPAANRKTGRGVSAVAGSAVTCRSDRSARSR